MPPPAEGTGDSHRERFSALTLNLPNLRSFPFQQTVRIPNGSVEETRGRVESALTGAGFRLAEHGGNPSMGTDRRTLLSDAIVAEKDLRRAPMSKRKRLSVTVIFGCGFVLGAFDALLFGNLLFAFPWILGTAVGAFVLWLAFGRAYESEVVVALIEPVPKTSAPAAVGSVPAVRHQVTWLAAEVRSEVFPGSAARNRDAVEVSDDFNALRALRAAVTQFGKVGAAGS